jgi:hypothetical protein
VITPRNTASITRLKNKRNEGQNAIEPTEKPDVKVESERAMVEKFTMLTRLVRVHCPDLPLAWFLSESTPESNLKGNKNGKS